MHKFIPGLCNVHVCDYCGNHETDSRHAIAETLPHSFSEITTWLEQEQAKQGLTEPETESDHKGPSEKNTTFSDSQKPPYHPAAVAIRNEIYDAALSELCDPEVLDDPSRAERLATAIADRTLKYLSNLTHERTGTL